MEVPATLGGPISPELPSGVSTGSSLTPLTVILGMAENKDKKK